MFNKVQVVYYLTRNGQLEHPHYMEVSHLATQPLRLKDVVDRLAVLRGKAMPSQYSWSCKRSYKNGYVWNDLTENDIIYASEGSEYVLKGSELLQEKDYSATQMEQEESYSLPSTSSTNSDKQPPPPTQVAKTTASESKRYDEKGTTRIIEEDGEPAVSTSLTRNSTQLSTRAVSTSNKAIPLRVKAGATGNEQPPCSINQEVSKECEDEDMMMVRYMSENPRFGNLQSEEKEYFSGTIVEAMSTHHQHTHSSGSASSYPHLPPVFTKSSSYNEQRSCKAGLQAEASVADIDDEKEDAKVKGFIKLCIPRKKSFSSTATKHNA
uniref:SOSEKI DIX-like domain-containing protein n=1 Tax=Chenopodium quinoa TaxID=63459 RepID=A0A803KXK9_CHEQI